MGGRNLYLLRGIGIEFIEELLPVGGAIHSSKNLLK